MPVAQPIGPFCIVAAEAIESPYADGETLGDFGKVTDQNERLMQTVLAGVRVRQDQRKMSDIVLCASSVRAFALLD